MRIIARSTLLRYAETLKGSREYRAVKGALDAWFHEVRAADWKSSSDVKKQYRNASFVGDERVVFNIKGNSYRLVVGISYSRQIVFIKWIGTHEEYNSIDVRTVKYADQAH